MTRKPFFITTPIYYVNDVPHIGHAYTTIAADVVARFKRLSGYEVYFLTGTDEHGQKVEKAALQAGLSPQQLSDTMVKKFQDLWKRLNISNTDFIRTTEKRHKQSVQQFFKVVQDKGDIYKGVYEDWYCIPCETFWTDLQLIEGNCPTCQRPVERLKEESYFFKMSRYQQALLDHIKKNPNFIHPVSRRNEVVRFVSDGLKDLSISRMSFQWGIPVPSDPDHVVYVWFDALLNYLTSIGYGRDKKQFKRFWPANVHLIGKDILRFHAVFWPCFLLSAGLPLPKQISTHGWWTVDGEKMSKSKGNVVDPHAVINRYGTDAFRYFLLREVPFGEDGDFSETAMTQRFNSELANDLGNLLSRTLTMIERYTEGSIPSPQTTVEAEDQKLKTQVTSLYEKISPLINQWAFHLVLIEIWKSIDLANQYIERNAPWELAKDPKKKARLQTVLYTLSESLRILSLCLYPFMPSTASRLWDQLGIKDPLSNTLFSRDSLWGKLHPGQRVKKEKHLFPRIVEPETSEKTLAPNKQPDSAIKKGKTPVKPSNEEDSTISIEDFKKLNLCVGRILEAEAIPEADRLLKLKVDIGQEVRQVVAGIAKRYSPEELKGMSVILVTNLKPVKIRGVESEGMILAAGDKEVESIATFLKPPSPGTIVR